LSVFCLEGENKWPVLKAVLLSKKISSSLHRFKLFLYQIIFVTMCSFYDQSQM